MKLLGSTKSRINKDKNGVVILNIVNNDYQQDSRVLNTFIPNKSFGKLLYISPKNFIFSKTFDLEFLYIEVLFPHQNYKPLEIEDKTNITLVIT